MEKREPVTWDLSKDQLSKTWHCVNCHGVQNSDERKPCVRCGTLDTMSEQKPTARNAPIQYHKKNTPRSPARREQSSSNPTAGTAMPSEVPPREGMR